MNAEPDLITKIERWLPVLGYEGFYEVSDQGRVRSVLRIVEEKTGKTKILKAKILRPGIGSTGYYIVALCRNSHQVTKKVHRLVLEAFVGLRPAGMACCHGPKGPLNNTLENLSWGTYSKNSGVDRLRDRTLGKKITAEIAQKIAVDQRTHDEIALEYAISPTTVRDIKSGKTWNYWSLPADNRGVRQGENHGSAKLTDLQVLSIRQDLRPAEAIAKDYGVSESLIYKIQKQKIWKHLQS